MRHVLLAALLSAVVPAWAGDLVPPDGTVEATLRQFTTNPVSPLVREAELVQLAERSQPAVQPSGPPLDQLLLLRQQWSSGSDFLEQRRAHR
jgi:hypothetical protein